MWPMLAHKNRDYPTNSKLSRYTQDTLHPVLTVSVLYRHIMPYLFSD